MSEVARQLVLGAVSSIHITPSAQKGYRVQWGAFRLAGCVSLAGCWHLSAAWDINARVQEHFYGISEANWI
jgi:hypothetical protein